MTLSEAKAFLSNRNQTFEEVDAKPQFLKYIILSCLMELQFQIPIAVVAFNNLERSFGSAWRFWNTGTMYLKKSDSDGMPYST